MDNFAATIGHLMLAHARIKALDRNALSDKRKTERAEHMAEIRRDVNQLMLIQFGELSAAAKGNAAELEAGAIAMAQSVAKAKTAIAVLDAVGSALGALTNLVGLIRG